MEHTEILIIGAGMAGLACAKALAASGREPIVIDKGRGPGGRMATRRAEIGGEVVAFDHGTQYFTARDPHFREEVEGWEELGVVARWLAANGEAWVGVPGMNGPIRAQARGLDVRWNTRALSLMREDGRWLVACEDANFSADTVLVAIPAEQAAQLLDRAAPDLATVAGQAMSEPCWTVMAGFAQPLDHATDTVRGEGQAIAWAARNSSKPERGQTRGDYDCWVIQASPGRSRELIDMSAEQVAPLLLGDFFAQSGTRPAAPIHLAAHRWLYAIPGAIDGEPARYDADSNIGIAGDYLHSPRVEGAWISGRALAEKVLG